MAENKLSDEEWSFILKKNWDLENEEKCKIYHFLVYSLDGAESVV